MEIIKLGFIDQCDNFETGPFILAKKYSALKLTQSLYKLADYLDIVCLTFSDFNIRFDQAIRLETYIIPKLFTEKF